jgi:enoyl-[acyl-carrier protein] reductase I
MIEHGARNAPIPEPLHAEEVGAAAAFLLSPLASGITGTTLFVDKGLHSVGVSAEAPAEERSAQRSKPGKPEV